MAHTRSAQDSLGGSQREHGREVKSSAPEKFTRLEEVPALQALHSIARSLAEPGSFVDQVAVVLEKVKTVLEVESADLRMPDAEEAGLRVVQTTILDPCLCCKCYC